MPMLSRTAPIAFAIALIAGCGGKSEVLGEDEGDDGGTNASGGSGSTGTGGTSRGGTGSGATGGSATGGSGAVGGSTGGSPGSGGDAGSAVGGSAGVGANGGTGGTTCCTAAPTCGPNEMEIPDISACPPGSMCHSVSVCCSTIWCATEPAQCDAFPACDEGDTVLEGACPPDVRGCYSRSLCGTTIWCLTSPCGPANAHNRVYVSKDPTECNAVDFNCRTELTAFRDECGCGCEQPADCPQYFYCRPNPENADAAPNPGAPGALPAPIPPVPMYCDPAELLRCPLSEIAD